MTDLAQLQADVQARVAAIRADHPDWPCRAGCAGCCRRLAEVPRLTAAEWAWLREGVAALPPEQRRDLRRAVAALSQDAPPPIVCPLLDDRAGTCRVYEQRPVACRTYGFYVERELGLYCGEIEARVTAGELAGVVWGNHAALERRLRELGESRPLSEWFADWRDDGAPAGAPPPGPPR